MVEVESWGAHILLSLAGEGNDRSSSSKCSSVHGRLHKASPYVYCDGIHGFGLAL